MTLPTWHSEFSDFRDRGSMGLLVVPSEVFVGENEEVGNDFSASLPGLFTHGPQPRSRTQSLDSHHRLSGARIDRVNRPSSPSPHRDIVVPPPAAGSYVQDWVHTTARHAT